MSRSVAVAFAAAIVGTVPAQQRPESGAEIAARVRAGGWLEQSEYRREPDGSLAIWHTAHLGGAEGGEWRPLLGDDDAAGFAGLGAVGWFTLFCHGDADLLAMTDAGFHFAALGIGTSDEEIRHFLATPPESFDGALGRAHLLDRVLAIDVLVARGCRAAAAELVAIGKHDAAPPLLRARAASALRRLHGDPHAGVERRRLDPQRVVLPAGADALLVVDHARLPDLRWLAPFGRRLGALVTANAIAAAGGTVSAAARNGGQRMCDVAAEAPFWFAHRFGNARLDQSIVAVTVTPGAASPIALTWNAAGEFEHDRWARATLPEGAARDNPLLGGTLSVEATTLHADTGRSGGEPRPELARELLAVERDAVRIVVPPASKAWRALAPLELPPARGAELRITFGDPALLVLAVEAGGEDAAEAWVTKGKELLAQAVADLRADLPPAVRGHADLGALLDALAAAAVSVKDGHAFAVVEVRGFGAARIAALLEAVVMATFS